MFGEINDGDIDCGLRVFFYGFAVCDVLEFGTGITVNLDVCVCVGRDPTQV